ncbi:L,D-transpeptidase family protein [Gammaproteobacteria bacterium]|nr:L,D-transpeptidase family protein [Gammaproteobacteria bacterium]
MRLFCALLAASLCVSANALTPSADPYERDLLAVIDLIRSGDIALARRQAEQLTDRYPIGRLGQLIYADLLAGRVTPLEQMASIAATEPALRQQRVDPLAEEARVRWASLSNDVHPARRGGLPVDLLAVSDQHAHVIYTDLKNHRLYVYSNTEDGLKLVADHFISVGRGGEVGKQKEGDKRTPIGVYFVTTELSDNRLPDLYGAGAFPLNYPNSIDRSYRRTGYGIWLHGVPRATYNREPEATLGCIALSNDELDAIRPYISAGTPVVITRDPSWIAPNRWRKQRDAVVSRIQQWGEDWASLDTDRYLAHYSPSQFRYDGGRFDNWAAYKHRVNSNKKFIEVDLSNIDVFRYPGEDNLVVAYVDQNYRSSNINSKTRKELQLRREDDGRWRIVREAPFDVKIDRRGFPEPG